MATQAQKAAVRRYYEKNKEKIRAYHKEYAKKNRDAIRAYTKRRAEIMRAIRDWNRENKEHTTYADWVRYIKARD